MMERYNVVEPMWLTMCYWGIPGTHENTGYNVFSWAPGCTCIYIYSI